MQLKRLHVQPRSTKQRIKVAGGKEAVVVGVVRGVQVTVEMVSTELSLLVVRNNSFAMIVRMHSVKKMRASPNFEKELLTFRHYRGATRIPLVMEGAEGDVHVNDSLAVHNSLTHLLQCEQRYVRPALLGVNFTDKISLEDLRPARVPYQHSFHLN